MPISTRSNGQTIDETWFNILKTEIEALQASRDLIKDGTSIDWELFGAYARYGAKNGVLYHRVNEDITVVAAVAYVSTAGSAGSSELDIKRKRGAGAWESIFTSRPVIPYTAGNNSDSATGTGATAAVIDSTKETLLAGDILRMDLLAVQTNAADILLSLEYEKTGA